MNRRHGTVVAVLMTLGLLTAGCAGGVEVAADDPGFRDCTQAAGISIEGAADWTVGEQRDFFTQPAALNCVLDELDRDQRTDVLSEAFPDPADDDTSSESYVRVRSILTDFGGATAATKDTDTTIDRCVALLNSLGWELPEYLESTGTLMALGILREVRGLPGYEEFGEKYQVDDNDINYDSKYATLLMRQDNEDADLLRDVEREIHQGLDVE